MAFVVIEIDASNDAVDQLNQILVNDSTKPQEGVVALRNLLDSMLAGARDASAAVVVRSTTSSPSASGGGISVSYNLK